MGLLVQTFPLIDRFAHDIIRFLQKVFLGLNQLVYSLILVLLAQKTLGLLLVQNHVNLRLVVTRFILEYALLVAVNHLVNVLAVHDVRVRLR